MLPCVTVLAQHTSRNSADTTLLTYKLLAVVSACVRAVSAASLLGLHSLSELHSDSILQPPTWLNSAVYKQC
jgi:hypothetical protein